MGIEFSYAGTICLFGFNDRCRPNNLCVMSAFGFYNLVFDHSFQIILELLCYKNHVLHASSLLPLPIIVEFLKFLPQCKRSLECGRWGIEKCFRVLGIDFENANIISQLLHSKESSLINGHDLIAKHMS